MLSLGGKSLQPDGSKEGQTCGVVLRRIVRQTHYQLSYAGPMLHSDLW